MRRWQWPLMFRSDHEQVRRENVELRQALRRANEELLKHRRLLAGLRNQQSEVVEAVEKAIRQN